jgi:Flp pilus assembly pilin Flp
MCSQLWRLLSDEDAATAVEYAVMLALIIGAVITAIGSVGTQTGGMWGNIQASVNAVGFGS